MTSFDLLEAIGEVDEELLEELNQTSPEGEKRILVFRRKYFSSPRRRFVTAALIACAGFVLCMGVGFYQNFLDSQHYTHKCAGPEMAEHQFAEEQAKSNSESIQRDTIDDSSEAEENENPASKKKAAILGEVQLNQINSLYGNAKLGGTLKEVSEEQWQEQYGEAKFLKGHSLHEKKYYLSYSEKNEVLYGMLHLYGISHEKLSYEAVEMMVSDGKMLSSSFEDLKKTTIGSYEIAICQCQSGEYEGDYVAIIPDGDVFYTIEESLMTLEEFEELIEEVFDYR